MAAETGSASASEIVSVITVKVVQDFEISSSPFSAVRQASGFIKVGAITVKQKPVQLL